uniref:Uncharacterized protein n=1 Tax=Pithovirus LCPAC406 TaxID=2506599 RepID=A0A481ZGW5_9VIRU|nr:MAG: uncharacterized protein LCPAC406_03440 [Pithovirus LCPAC406]
MCNNDKNNPGIDIRNLEPELLIFLDKRNSDLIQKRSEKEKNINIKTLNTLNIGSYRTIEGIVYNEVEDYYVEFRYDLTGWRSHKDIIDYVLNIIQHKYQIIEVEIEKTVTEFNINGYSLIIISDGYVQSF